MKRFLNSIVNEELEPIRAKRKEFEQDMGAVYDILVDGTGKAREVAANTLAEVKQAMKLNYFDDKALILK